MTPLGVDMLMYALPSLPTWSNHTFPSGPATIPTERTVKLNGLLAAVRIGNRVDVPETVNRPMLPPTGLPVSPPVVNQRLPSLPLVM